MSKLGSRWYFGIAMTHYRLAHHETIHVFSSGSSLLWTYLYLDKWCTLTYGASLHEAWTLKFWIMSLLHNNKRKKLICQITMIIIIIIVRTIMIIISTFSYSISLHINSITKAILYLNQLHYKLTSLLLIPTYKILFISS